MITWGRRPLPPPRASGWQRALLAILVVCVGAAAAVPDRFVARTPSIIAPETMSTVQGLFDLHRAAIERGDRVSYELTLDPRSRDFLACMRRLFEQGRARSDALAPARVLSLEHVEGTNVVRVRLQQRDGVGVHYVRRFLVGPVTAFPWIDMMRSVPAWYISFPDASRPGECVEQIVRMDERLPFAIGTAEESVASTDSSARLQPSERSDGVALSRPRSRGASRRPLHPGRSANCPTEQDVPLRRADHWID